MRRVAVRNPADDLSVPYVWDETGTTRTGTTRLATGATARAAGVKLAVILLAARFVAAVTARATGGAPAGPNPLTFAGAADGTPPAPWVISNGGTGSSSVVDTERLKQTSGSGGGTYHGARAFYGTDTFTDFTRSGRVAIGGTGDRFANIVFRADGWTGNGDTPTNGYMLSIRPQVSTVRFNKMASSSYSEPSGASGSYTPAADVWWELVVSGSTFTARVWAVGGTYPASPTVSWTGDTTHTSGKWGVSFASANASQVAYWDDFALGAWAAPPPIAGVARIAAGATVRAAGGVPLPFTTASGTARVTVGVRARATGAPYTPGVANNVISGTDNVQSGTNEVTS